MSEVAMCTLIYTASSEKITKIFNNDDTITVEINVPEEKVLDLAARIMDRRWRELYEGNIKEAKQKQDAAEKRVRDFFFRAEVPGEGAL